MPRKTLQKMIYIAVESIKQTHSSLVMGSNNTAADLKRTDMASHSSMQNIRKNVAWVKTGILQWERKIGESIEKIPT